MTSQRSFRAQLLILIITCSLTAPALTAQNRRPRVRVVPRATSITFDTPDPTLAPKKQIKVKATVLDQNGRPMPNAKVTWEGVLQSAESPLTFGRSLDDAEGNSIIITAGAGTPGLHERISTRIHAVSDEASRDLFVTYESTPKPPPAKIAFSTASVDLDPDGEATVTATVTDSDDKAVHGGNVKWSLANPDMSKFVRLGTVVNDDKTNSITVLGRSPKEKMKAPDAVTLVATVGTAVGVVTINYKAPPEKQKGTIETSWSVLSPGICGDNFGRTIRNDYYCIEVAIDNHSDSDVALGGLKFKTEDDIEIITSHYPVVQGSLARRKITHPRAITMATIDAMGSLLTGFNPFFHNINHAKNYSQFIDILSNPVAKGVGMVWQDSYPIELANFSSMILKDDKIIKKGDPTFKTVVFVEKRNLFPNKDENGKKIKDRDDPIKVKAKLGTLIVMGQDIQQGESRNLAQ